jgi:stage II sporulation protein R
MFVANSNSEADQALKLKVRDRIMRETQFLLDGAEAGADAVNIISKNLDKITAAAKRPSGPEGRGYDVTAKLAVEYFRHRITRRFLSPRGSTPRFAW